MSVDLMTKAAAEAFISGEIASEMAVARDALAAAGPGLFFPKMANVEMVTGRGDYASSYQSIYKGVLSLGPIYMVGAHLVGIGLDTSYTGTGNVDDEVRFGLYEIVNGLPRTLVLDAGIITDWSTPGYLSIAIDEDLDPTKFYAAGMVLQGPNDYGPSAWYGTAEYTTASFSPWYPTDASLDPESTYYDAYGTSIPAQGGYPAMNTLLAGTGYGMTGWIYCPDNGDGTDGVLGALPATLPSAMTGFRDSVNNTGFGKVGWGPDGGYSAYINLRTGA